MSRMGQVNVELAPMLRALADPSRMRVIELLSHGPRRSGELARELDVAPPSMSKQLRVLLAARLIEDERRPEDARVRVFRLRQESVVSLRAWLDQIQAHWDEQLGSFKTHIERKEQR